VPYQVRNPRKILCVAPAFSPSFGTFEYSYPIHGTARACMPPLGLLTIAEYLPKQWELRFIDQNIEPVRDGDLDWADAVFITGMHVQRSHILALNERAHARGKTTVLGGPSVSGCREYYPDLDYLHIGELGDATDRLIGILDEDPSRPAAQVQFETDVRLDLTDFPPPAFRLVPLYRYLLGALQFSSGCPYRCEFCDIPALYGRNARLKTPEQVIAELDLMLQQGIYGPVYFVDDNFIANRRAAKELMPHLIEWQKRNGYPFQFSCESTLNIAKYPELLAMMREAYFITVFCGIETPELNALQAMRKEQNADVPILEAVEIINSYGMEIVSGIILGLDTDTPDSAQRIIEFIRQSNIPMLTINLLQALPRTPLYDRLKAAGRLIEDSSRDSNIDFLLPYEQVVGMWKQTIAAAYDPDTLYRRFAYNCENTFSKRIERVFNKERTSWANIRRGLRIMTNLFLRVGIASGYRRTFWRFAWPLLRAGRIEDVAHVGLVSHHLIWFAREAVSGEQAASLYSHHTRSKRKFASAEVA
jgi:radical SAM superfamily enzyme YgiQ (UPF0313 family)